MTTTYIPRQMARYITAYAVRIDGQPVGMVASKAIGTGTLTRSNSWTAIRRDGSTVGGFDTRADAAEALR